MNDRPPRPEPHTALRLFRAAREIADGADRWFVSLARGLGRSGLTGAQEPAEPKVRRDQAAPSKQANQARRRHKLALGPSPLLDRAIAELAERVQAAEPSGYPCLRDDAEFWRLLKRAQEVRAAALQKAAERPRAAPARPSREEATAPKAAGRHAEETEDEGQD